MKIFQTTVSIHTYNVEQEHDLQITCNSLVCILIMYNKTLVKIGTVHLLYTCKVIFFFLIAVLHTQLCAQYVLDDMTIG